MAATAVDRRQISIVVLFSEHLRYLNIEAADVFKVGSSEGVAHRFLMFKILVSFRL